MRVVSDVYVSEFNEMKNISLGNLKTFNIITSKNCLGKTSVLQAVAFSLNAGNSQSLLSTLNKINDLPLSNVEFLKNVFKHKDKFFIKTHITMRNTKLNKTIKARFTKIRFIGKCKTQIGNAVMSIFDEKIYDIVIPIRKDEPFEKSIINFNYSYLSFSPYKVSDNKIIDFDDAKRKKILLNFLNMFIDVKDIFMKKDIPYISNSNDEVSCIYSLGSTIQNALLLFNSVYSVENSIVFIDNIDNFFFDGMRYQLINFFINGIMKTNNQCFITIRDNKFKNEFIDCLNKKFLDDELRNLEIFRDENDLIKIR